MKTGKFLTSFLLAWSMGFGFALAQTIIIPDYKGPNYYLPDTIGPVHADAVENLLANGDFESPDYEEEEGPADTGMEQCYYHNLLSLPGWWLRFSPDSVFYDLNKFLIGTTNLQNHTEGEDANRQYIMMTMGLGSSDWKYITRRVEGLEIGATYKIDFFARQYIQPEPKKWLGDVGGIGLATLPLDKDYDKFDSDENIRNDLCFKWLKDYFEKKIDRSVATFISLDNYLDWTYMHAEFVATTPSVAIYLWSEDWHVDSHFSTGQEHIANFDEVRLYKIADSGIASAEQAQARAVGGRGCIAVSGLPQGAEVEVVALDGRVAYKGAAGTIPAAPGCYVVRSQGWASKVAVR